MNIEELTQKAKDVLEKRYEKGKHTVCAAVKTKAGNIYTGVCMNSQKLDVCSEWVAVGQALTAGDTEIEMAVALHQMSDGGFEIYPPCSLCRELYLTYAPDAMIVLPGEKVIVAKELLPYAWVKNASMAKSLNLNFEKAVRFLVANFPESDETSRKPLLAHDIRVGVYLYENGYQEDVVIAGLLHDVLEWSDVAEEQLRAEFGGRILELVKANTKDDSITDPQEKTNELIKRCAQTGEDALIIKTADILDSYEWYTAQKNEGELEYCKRNAEAIVKYKAEEWQGGIFEELQKRVEE